MPHAVTTEMSVGQPPGEQHGSAEHWPISSFRLGELLLRSGAVEPEALEAALRRQESGSRLPIGRLLIELGAISEDTLTKTLAQQFGLPVLYPDREPLIPTRRRDCRPKRRSNSRPRRSGTPEDG